MRHYARELDPLSATLPDPSSISTFTYANLVRFANQRPALLFAQNSSADPVAVWELLAPFDKTTGFPIYLKTTWCAEGVPSGIQTCKFYIGIEIVKPNGTQALDSGSAWSSPLLWATPQTLPNTGGQPFTVLYQFPDAQVSTLLQDDTVRVLVGIQRSATPVNANLYMTGGVFYDEM